MLLKYDAWNWLNFSQNEKKWYSDNFQEPSKGAQHQITARFMYNGFISGIKPSEFFTVLVCRG